MVRRGAGRHSGGMFPASPAPQVFIVDDSAPVRERVAALLQSHAMTIVGEAATPQAAIDGILATRPDVVVLDVQLLGGSGLEVMRGVRHAAGRADDPAFVVFSNNAAPAYRRRYLGEGAARFLDKSVELDQLVPAVAQASGNGTAPPGRLAA